MRLQQLFPRIVAADYEQPKRVSEDCRHLLKRMLTPDPAKRVTIPEIMQHPWCALRSASQASMLYGLPTSAEGCVNLTLKKQSRLLECIEEHTQACVQRCCLRMVGVSSGVGQHSYGLM